MNFTFQVQYPIQRPNLPMAATSQMKRLHEVSEGQYHLPLVLAAGQAADRNQDVSTSNGGDNVALIF